MTFSLICVIISARSLNNRWRDNVTHNNFIVSRAVTIETRLQNDSNLVRYLNVAVTEYELVKRKIWHEMINSNYKKKFSSDYDFEKHCRAKYGLHSRAINSIIRDIRGQMCAYMELKKTELHDLESKISSYEKKVEKTKENIRKWKSLVIKNLVTDRELRRYRKNKTKLYNQQNKLNRLKQKRDNLQYIIDHKIYKVCFGSKRTLKKQYNLRQTKYKTREKWHNDFVKRRDKNIWLTGSINEKDGNQMVALSYDSETDTFSIKLRKIERGNWSKYDADKYITYDNIKFNYHKQDIINLIENQVNNDVYKQAIHFRFHREGTKWYLQIVYMLNFRSIDYVTRSNNGVIGLDYNNGFIQLAETDATGNLINLIKYDLKHHGTGKKAETEIKQVLNTIVKYSVSVGKDIVAEKLNFKKTKAETHKAKSKKSKKHNNMIHMFDYHRYISKLQDITFNNRVYLYLINPKNTTKIAKQKYCPKRKLTSHQGASYVIARRAQGFKDTLKSA